MTFPDQEHLSKTYLTDEMDRFAHKCREWLRETAFEPMGDYNVCVRCRIPQNNRDFMSLITSGASESMNMKYNGMRFTKPVTLRVRRGETMILIPLYVESGSPTVDGVSVADGEILWLKKDVVVEPRFFCLTATTRSYLPK